MPRNDAVPEVPFRIEIAGGPTVRWSCSPEHPDALALGWLLAEGFLEVGEPLPSPIIATDGPGIRVGVELNQEQLSRGGAVRRAREAGGWGVAAREPRARQAPPEPDSAASLLRALFGDGEERPGGLHAASLSDGSTLVRRVEEVSRHNAVDKVVGLALLAGHGPDGLGLVVTSRVSGEIAWKAARAGLSWIVSRSVPTTLALEIAGAVGIPILARAVGRSARLFAPAEAGG